ncbi:MAG: hypothetical protein IPK88_07875 [Saprospiraceae bacterium]|nr:hypothetical protein [Candidatus Defluviibacterium haderslevense]
MRRKVNKENTIYSHLKTNGVLEKGTHEEIQKVRSEYWREYKRKWRVAKRRKDKEFAVSFNSDELKVLTFESKKHKLSRTQFIKETTFAYINNSFIVPDLIEVKKISQLLAMTYNSVQDLFDANKLNFDLGRDIMESINRLEREILPFLHHPKTLEEYIKLHIAKDGGNKAQLLEFINSL